MNTLQEEMHLRISMYVPERWDQLNDHCVPNGTLALTSL